MFCVYSRVSLPLACKSSKKRWDSVAFHLRSRVPRMNGRRTSRYGNGFSNHIDFSTTAVGFAAMRARCAGVAVISSGQAEYAPPESGSGNSRGDGNAGAGEIETDLHPREEKRATPARSSDERAGIAATSKIVQKVVIGWLEIREVAADCRVPIVALAARSSFSGPLNGRYPRCGRRTPHQRCRVHSDDVRAAVLRPARAPPAHCVAPADASARGRRVGRARLGASARAKAERVAEEKLDSNADDDGMSLAAEFSKRLDGEGGRIGLEEQGAQENVEEAARAARRGRPGRRAGQVAGDAAAG